MANALSAIPGQYIAAGETRLPLPSADIGPQSVYVDAGQWGRFRITYVAMRNQEAGCGRHQWFRTAESAVRLGLGE